MRGKRRPVQSGRVNGTHQGVLLLQRPREVKHLALPKAHAVMIEWAAKDRRWAEEVRDKAGSYAIRYFFDW
jgi:hypothetical protein